MKITFCSSPHLARATPWAIRIGTPFWRLSNAERAAVILHELGHYKHKHLWQHLWFLFAWPFAPLYFAKRVKEHEFEADLHVVKHGFGTALVNVLSQHVNEPPGPLHPSAFERIVRIKQEMERLHAPCGRVQSKR
jgi:beta-lactamase regulating signal transducer with metallopeptidase domain